MLYCVYDKFDNSLHISMKISDNFPVLQKVNALFVVSGKQSAVIYQLRRGEINERDTIKIKKPEYTDREGHFEYRGPRGRLYGSGSVYEPKNEYVQKKFLTSLVKEIKQVRRPFDSIYLFAPMYVVDQIEAALPNSISTKIKRKFTGNFTKQHPTDLLNKVKTRREFKAKTEARKRAIGEAAKILRRGRRMVKRIGRRKVIR